MHQVFSVRSPGQIFTNPPSGISRVLELQVCTTVSRSVFNFQRTVQLTVVWTDRLCIKIISGEIVKFLAGVNSRKFEIFHK